jgi:membrane-bound metal-dependent hydrolase YbcI (DUF457 family)
MLDMEHVKVSPGMTQVVPLEFSDYPLSHSLFMTVAWSCLVGLLYLAFTKDGRGACVMGVLVASHWVLDWFVHRPDLPIWPVELSNFGSPKVGLMLWNKPVMTYILEFGLLALGLFLYHMVTKAKDATGEYAFWGLALALVGIYIANLYVLPPNNTQLISLMGFSQLLLVAWGYWIDDHRRDR